MVVTCKGTRHANSNKFNNIYYFPSLSKLQKKIGIHLDAKGIKLCSSFNSKLRDWSTGCKIHFILLSVSSDACQERYLTMVKTLSSFYNHTGYLFLHTNDKFLSPENDFMCSKIQNIKTRGQERDRATNFQRPLHIVPTKSLRKRHAAQASDSIFACDLSVTGICISRSFTSKFGHCPRASVLYQ